MGGNKAFATKPLLQFRTRHKEALDGIKLARELAIWFHSSFGKAGTVIPPKIPATGTANAMTRLLEPRRGAEQTLTSDNEPEFAVCCSYDNARQ